MLSALFLLILIARGATKNANDISCKWDSKSGAHYDLRPLTKTDENARNYDIIDGDIPCTPETEPSFGYTWNFCDPITKGGLPAPCNKMGKDAVVMQYAEFSEDEYYCYILGHYDETQHELHYELLDPTNPALGLSIKYPAGEKCAPEKANVLRTATIDVYCANVDTIIMSAQEPTLCQYHMVMKSYHGCPTECPITKNGLCDSHGHCAFDPLLKSSYCFCNEGYYGASCSSTSSSADVTTYDGFSVQIGLLVTLLIFALALTGAVIYLAYMIAEYRKEQVANNYATLPGEAEMVETVQF